VALKADDGRDPLRRVKNRATIGVLSGWDQSPPRPLHPGLEKNRSACVGTLWLAARVPLAGSASAHMRAREFGSDNLRYRNHSSDDRIAYAPSARITDVQQRRRPAVMDVHAAVPDSRCFRPRRSLFSGQATSDFAPAARAEQIALPFPCSQT